MPRQFLTPKLLKLVALATGIRPHLNRPDNATGCLAITGDDSPITAGRAQGPQTAWKKRRDATRPN